MDVNSFKGPILPVLFFRSPADYQSLMGSTVAPRTRRPQHARRRVPTEYRRRRYRKYIVIGRTKEVSDGACQTSLVLPGSANAIGGQGVVIKLRPPTDRSPTGMLLESPYETNGTVYDPRTFFRYRQMKYVSFHVSEFLNLIV